MSEQVPGDRRYAATHEWAKPEGSVLVGLTAFAVHELGDLVFVDLPEKGAAVTAGEAFGEIESVKAVSELMAPVSGTIAEVNIDIEDALETLVESPYEDGWLIRIDASDPAELDALLSAEDYEKQLAEHEE